MQKSSVKKKDLNKNLMISTVTSQSAIKRYMNQMKAYKKSVKRINKSMFDTEEMNKIKKKFQTKKIKIIKYNYCLDTSVQNFSSFEGFI